MDPGIRIENGPYIIFLIKSKRSFLKKEKNEEKKDIYNYMNEEQI